MLYLAELGSFTRVLVRIQPPAPKTIQPVLLVKGKHVVMHRYKAASKVGFDSQAIKAYSDNVISPQTCQQRLTPLHPSLTALIAEEIDMKEKTIKNIWIAGYFAFMVLVIGAQMGLLG